MNHADKSGLLGTSPRRLWGTKFDKPGKNSLRLAKNQADKTKPSTERGKSLTPEQIHAAIAAAKNPQLKAMILLGINCGFGNTDCG